MDTRAERPRWRVNGSVALSERLKVGLEWNPGASEVLPTANWVALTSGPGRPMVSLGTSSDRIFSPEGTRAWFATAAWSQGRLGPYVGVSYSQWQDRLLVPFGLNVALDPQWDLLGMNDGVNTHLLLTRKFQDVNITLMLVKLKHVGLSVGFGW